MCSENASGLPAHLSPRLLSSEQLRSGLPLEQASSVVWRRWSPATHPTSQPSPQRHSPQTMSPPSIHMVTPPTLSPSQGWPSCLFLGPSRPFPSPFSFQMSLQPGRAGRMSLTLQLPWSSLLTSFFSLNPKFLKELSPFATFTSCLFTVIYYFIHSFFGQIYILFFNLLFLINLF